MGNLTAWSGPGSLEASEEPSPVVDCPQSVGLRLRGRGVTEPGGWAGVAAPPVIHSTKNASALLRDLLVTNATGLSFELWLSFDEDALQDWGKEDAIFAVGSADLDPPPPAEGGNGTAAGGSSCSLGWAPFSFQLRQRGPFLVAETRWGVHAGRPLCEKTDQVAVVGPTQIDAEVFLASPHHVMVTIDGDGSAGRLSIFVDGKLSAWKELPPPVLPAGFIDTWDGGHRLLLGASSAFGTSWAGTIHSASAFAVSLSKERVGWRRENWEGMAHSLPVVVSKVARVHEDEDSSIQIESFDFDGAHRPGSGNATASFYITRSTDLGRLAATKGGAAINVTKGQTPQLLVESASIAGRGIASVNFLPEKDAHSLRSSLAGGGLLPYTSFEYKACDADGHCGAPGTILVEVLGVNDPPVALPSVQEVYLGTTQPITLGGLDPDGQSDITGVEIVGLPAHGVLQQCEVSEGEGGEILLGSPVVQEGPSNSSFRHNQGASGKRLCYTFANESHALAGLKDGLAVVAEDSLSFRVSDSHNVTSTDASNLLVRVLNPLVAENKTMACLEDTEAEVTLAFADVREDKAGDLGIRILSLPKFGSLYHRDAGNGSVRLPVAQGGVPSGWLEPCPANAGTGTMAAVNGSCVTLVYEPTEDFFNSPDPLGGLEAQRFSDLGVRERPPQEFFAYEITKESCRSPPYLVNLRVSNAEDESSIVLPEGPVVARYLEPTSIPGITILDPDGYTDLFVVDLYVTAGVLDIPGNISALDHLVFLMGDGHDDAKMVFKGIPSQVNLALGNLTYTALTKSGQETLRLRFRDTDSKSYELGDSLEYATYNLELNITVLGPRGAEGSGGRGSQKRVCFADGACVSERSLYGALFVCLMAILLSPALFWAYKACSFAIRLALWPLKSSTPGKVRTQDLLAQSRFKDTLVIPRQSATI